MPRAKPGPAGQDDPGYTPAASALGGLFDELALASREEAPRLERIVARAGDKALAAVLERLPHAEATLRARLVSILGRLADPRAASTLRGALDDREPQVVRRAANALGKLAESDEDATNEAALRARWGAADAPLKRSLAEALGKLGGEEARALLCAERSDDPELSRLVAKALLLIERRASRNGAARIRTDAPLGRELVLLASCRAGLATLLCDELRPLGAARVRSPSVVELPFSGRLAELFVARTALELGLEIPLPTLSSPSVVDAIAQALAGEPAQSVLHAWSDGPPRYRLSFAEGGHQRALLFRIVEAVSRSAPALVNDSRAASWEIVIVRDDPRPHLVLVPLGFEDPRFSYRQREVRAASHPTIAAALARTAGARPSDVVWDPFLGSGLELVERAKLGPFRALYGSDLDPEALAAARENLDAAGVRAELRQGDAIDLHPERVSLVITNPPMGRRLARDRSLAPLMTAFVSHAARVLVPGGRLVWLSPLPELTARTAQAAGLRAELRSLVDMGGFDAELQVLARR